jgi:hypothetical protein
VPDTARSESSSSSKAVSAAPLSILEFVDDMCLSDRLPDSTGSTLDNISSQKRCLLLCYSQLFGDVGLRAISAADSLSGLLRYPIWQRRTQVDCGCSAVASCDSYGVR